MLSFKSIVNPSTKMVRCPDCGYTKIVLFFSLRTKYKKCGSLMCDLFDPRVY